MAETEARQTEANAESSQHPSEPSALERMKRLTGRLLRVPKSEIQSPKRKRGKK